MPVGGQVMPVKLFRHTGLRVSALCLGAMTFGEERAWGAGKSASRAVFERFAECGGNFIDTANNYMNGTSEEFLGEFLAGRREQFVLGTKYSLTLHPDDPNGGGNHRKSYSPGAGQRARRSCSIVASMSRASSVSSGPAACGVPVPNGGWGAYSATSSRKRA